MRWAQSLGTGAKLGVCALLVFILAALVAASAVNSNGDRPKSQADDLRPGAASSPGKSWAGKDPAPPFPDGLRWFNVRKPLTLEDLRGKVVLLDFWTQG